MIIMMGNQKGGCGKTTIATNMAAVLAGKDKDVILFDADRQGSAYGWVSDRNKYHPDKPRVHTSMGYDTISDAVVDLSRRYDVVIIDVPGRESNECRSGLTVTDILMIPVKPSQVDLLTLPTMQQMVIQSRFVNPKLKAFAFLNIAPTHAKNQEIRQSRDVMAEYTHLSTLKAMIHDRKCFRDAFSEGLGVTEMGGRSDSDISSRLEIESLIEEMLGGN